MVQSGGVRVLVVDDEPAVRSSLRRSLTFHGCTVQTADDGSSALEHLESGDDRPDVVVLDIGLPDLDGFEVCRRLRSRGDLVPVLMLTARGATSDRVTGLTVGADDYLPKPFEMEELLARLRALVRRSAAGAAFGFGEVLQVGDLVMDTRAREARRAGQDLALTRTEFDLLEMFVRHPRQVLSRGRIMEEVWGYDFSTTSNSLDVYVGYLRRKTEGFGGSRLLHTVRGVGYVLKAGS